MRPFLKIILALFVMLVYFETPGICQLQEATTFVYVNNNINPSFGPNTVSAFLAHSDGTLKELKDSPFGTGGVASAGGCVLPNHIAIAGAFLYVSNDGDNNISGFSINQTTGKLTLVTIPPVPSGLNNAYCGITLATTPDGRFLYASNNGYETNTIVAFQVEPSGALRTIPGQSLYGGAVNLKVSPDGKLLAAVSPATGVTMFSIGSEGALTQVGHAPVFGDNLDFNCGSNLLFVASGGPSDVIAVLNIAPNGTLTPIADSPFSITNNGGYLFPLQLSPDDLHLYVASDILPTSSTSIVHLKVSGGGGGSVTQQDSSESFFGVPVGLATNQLGTLLYLTYFTSPFSSSVNVYAVNPKTGDPDKPPISVPLPSGARLPSIAVFPPKTCFGNLAAQQALTDEGGKYGDGGKGFDFSGSGKAGFPPGSDDKPCEFQPSNGQATSVAPCWITPADINSITSGYWYYDSNDGYDKTPAEDYGMDCAGLVMWSYDTAVDATAIAQAPGSPASGADAKLLPIWWEGAGVAFNIVSISRSGDAVTVTTSTANPFMAGDSVIVSGVVDSSFSGKFVIASVISSTQFTYVQAGSNSVSSGGTATSPPHEGQCTDAQSAFLTDDLGDISHPENYKAPLDLRPGDLLCFEYHYKDGTVGGHVAMYLGRETTKLSNINQKPLDTIEDFDRPHGGVVFDHVDSMGISNLGRAFEDISSTKNCSITKSNVCFDFLGYRRPKAPRVAILWQVHSPVSLSVTDPSGFTIDDKSWIVTQHQAYRAAGSLAYNDYSPNGDDMVFSPILEPGAYIAKVVPKTGAVPSDVYGLTVTAGGTSTTLADHVPISQIPPLGYGVESNGATITPFTPVAIEIKPGSTMPTPINTKGSGKIPVAILSAANFSALRVVNASSLTFGREGDERSLASCDMNGEDVNGDGLPDLVCHFYAQKTGFKTGDAEGVLKGLTYAGQVIRGTGAIRIVP